MNILNLDLIANSRGVIQQSVAELLAGAMAIAVPTNCWIANRYSNTQVLSVGAVINSVQYPDKAPITEGTQNVNTFFYGDCGFSFDATVLAGGAWYVRVYADGPLVVSPLASSGIVYYASNVVNSFQIGEVIHVPIPRIPLTSIRVEMYHEGNMSIRSSISWTGLLFRRS